MASIYRDADRDGWRVQLYVRGVRRKLWLGPVPKSAAQHVATHLDNLNRARDTGTIPPAETRRWLSSISDRIRNRIAAWGLADQTQAAKNLERTLGAYVQSLIDGRDDWSKGTKSRMRNVRRLLVAQLGDDTALAGVTPGDAQRFARWCRSNIVSKSHSGKTIADARQIFKSAIADRLLADNPFMGIDTSQGHDKTRDAYLTPDDAAALIALADPYYAALIAAARFAGLRMPSEVLTLQWDQVNWETGRFVCTSPKLARHHPTRIVPLFAEFRPHLERLQELASDGSVFVFDRYRSTAARVYRAGLLRLIGRAGLQPWPKLWMNLRASCRTDLLEQFPAHVVNEWLGHSGKIGAKHYDRTHDAHFAAAVGSPVGSLSRVPSLPAAESEAKTPVKTRETRETVND
jgi:integrase